MRDAALTKYSQIEMDQDVLGQIRSMAFRPSRMDDKLVTSPYSPLHAMPMLKPYVSDPFKKMRQEKRRQRALRRKAKAKPTAAERAGFFKDDSLRPNDYPDLLL